jgi:hypothetical protein
MGFPQAALTFLNQPAVVADARAGLGQMWEQASENGRGDFTKSCKCALDGHFWKFRGLPPRPPGFLRRGMNPARRPVSGR